MVKGQNVCLRHKETAGSLLKTSDDWRREYGIGASYDCVMISSGPDMAHVRWLLVERQTS